MSRKQRRAQKAIMRRLDRRAKRLTAKRAKKYGCSIVEAQDILLAEHEGVTLSRSQLDDPWTADGFGEAHRAATAWEALNKLLENTDMDVQPDPTAAAKARGALLAEAGDT